MNDLTWQLDQNITAELAKTCIQEQFFKVHEIVRVGQGADNVVFLVNQKFIFRFSRHQEMDALRETENTVLAKLQNIISLQIPDPIYQGIPTQKFPFHFQGYEKLPGVALYESDLTDEQLKLCLCSFAQFLKELHSIKADQACTWGAQQSAYDKTKIDLVIQVLHERVTKVQNLKICEIDRNFVEQEIAVASKIVIPRNNDCLVHNDLDIRHLLIRDGKLSGIIDWSDVDINHPVVDFACVWAIFPISMHDIFFKFYGNIDQNVWNYGRILALTRSVTLMLAGHQMKDAKLLQVAIKSYEILKRRKTILSSTCACSCII
ncbi:hypothetical protein A3J41_01935 [candidate division TM6 bacterium RIFCSPHIGHO2_12_FULL_38_8]|nr:MAG: hypothetical protein A3J41_01935 [candidate division TM6 bacterium RIFCSPHIGHO2_12_FULL_38_8]